MKALIILGTGGNCLDIYDAVLAINRQAGGAVYHCLGFLDDNPRVQGRQIAGLPVLGGLEDAQAFSGALFVNGIGSPASFWQKQRILDRTGIAVERFETIVHPQAAVSSLAKLGHGVAILAGASVGASAEIGHHVVLLQGAVVSHDCRIGDYCCVASGACLSGAVTMEPLSYIGANATVRGDVKIGTRSLVGLGAVVLRSIPDNAVVVGNPARELRRTVPEA